MKTPDSLLFVHSTLMRSHFGPAGIFYVLTFRIKVLSDLSVRLSQVSRVILDLFFARWKNKFKLHALFTFLYIFIFSYFYIFKFLLHFDFALNLFCVFVFLFYKNKSLMFFDFHISRILRISRIS